MIRQVSHDFGNLFHRSYHCIDTLASKVGAGVDGAPELVETLARSVEETERRCRAILRYVGPVEADPTSLAAADLLDSFGRYLDPLELAVDGPAEWAQVSLSVDCALAAAALTGLAAHTVAHGGPRRRVIAAVTVTSDAVHVDLDLDRELLDRPDPELRMALVHRQLTAFGAGFDALDAHRSRLTFARAAEGAS